MKTVADIPSRLRQITRVHIGYCKNCFHKTEWHSEIDYRTQKSKSCWCRHSLIEGQTYGYGRDACGCKDFNPVTPADYLRFRQLLKDNPRPPKPKKPQNFFPGKVFVLKVKDKFLKKGSWDWSVVDNPSYATLWCYRSGAAYQWKNIHFYSDSMKKTYKEKDVEIHLIEMKVIGDEKVDIVK